MIGVSGCGLIMGGDTLGPWVVDTAGAVVEDSTAKVAH